MPDNEPSNGGMQDRLDLGLPVDEHEEEELTEAGQKVRRRGIFLLPNLLTTCALFAGFYAIVHGMNKEFESASIAIFVAMFFDGLDGRVARLTGTESAFGVQYDSLSDMVSFGVAPALLSFSWASGASKIGWAAAFIYAAAFVYVAGAALRLARFNTQVGTVDNNYFRGLASPAAAALLASLVWTASDLGYKDLNGVASFFAALLTALAGLLMVSNFRYLSFKKFDLKRRVPFVIILMLVLLIGLVTVYPPSVLLMAVAYALSGPGQLTWERITRRAAP